MPSEYKEPDEIDCWAEDEPVCPWCGQRLENAWEFDMGDGDERTEVCGRCERKFVIVCEISTTYNTSKSEED